MFKTIHRKGLKCITLLLSLLLSFNAVGVCYAEGEQEQPIVEETSEVEETTEEESEEITEENEEELPDSEDINTEGNDEQIQQENNENDIAVVDDTDGNDEKNYISIVSEYADDVPSYISDVSTNDIPSSYQLDKTKYPDVRDQGNYGTCWAFAALGLSEFSLINQGLADQSIDLSELQLAYFTYNSVLDPLGGTAGDQSTYYNDVADYNYLNRGGMYEYAVRRLAQWSGAVNESDVPYNTTTINNVLTNGLSSEYAYSKDVAHLKNAYVMSLKNNSDDVKRTIMSNGAVGVQYYHSDSSLLWNSNQQLWTYYSSTNSGGGHNVMVVGWDDNFSKDNFVGEKPENDGAWLIRNSWGFTQSYFWMSYENQSLLDAAWAFEMDSANNYDNNYQLDGGVDSFNVTNNICAYKTYSNIFTVQNKDGVSWESLDAVSLSFTHVANVNYTIEIYTDLDPNNPYPNHYYGGTKQESATTTGTTTYAGLYTIPLKNSVQLKPGSTFAIVVTTDNYALDFEQGVLWETDGNTVWDASVKLSNGKSFYGTKTNQWPWGYGNFCIKAFTTNNKHVHTWDSGTITKKATCIEQGSITYTCTDTDCDETKTEVIPYAEHTYNSETLISSATCESPAKYEKICSVCGHSEEYEVGNALGHNWVTKRIEPTCTSTGKEYLECTKCKKQIYTDTIPKIAHKYETIDTKDATCTNTGYIKYQCSICGNSYTDTVAKKAHTYKIIDTKNATCTNKGSHTYRCTSCGHTYTIEDVAALGHSWKTKKVEPTCTSSGKEYQECTRCGAHGSEKTLSALGHSWNVIENHDATCTQEGYKKYKCSRCGSTYTNKISKKGHTWATKRIEPTCTSAGKEYQECTRCGAHGSEKTLSALGHSWNVIENHAATCTQEGYKKYKCSRCGSTYTNKISKKSHTWVSKRVEPTCTSTGKEYRECTKCGAHDSEKTLSALGHSWSNWTTVQAATSSKEGKERRTCNRCGKVEERSISKLYVERVSMYRVYNPNSGEHFYTSNKDEKNDLTRLGWHYEGIGWNAPKFSNYPVYRLYNPVGGEHHYTLSVDEKKNLVRAGWKDEGIGWYSADPNGSDSIPVKREYNPNAFANNHNYTISLDEHNWLIGLGWKDEGNGWFALK